MEFLKTLVQNKLAAHFVAVFFVVLMLSDYWLLHMKMMARSFPLKMIIKSDVSVIALLSELT